MRSFYSRSPFVQSSPLYNVVNMGDVGCNSWDKVTQALVSNTPMGGVNPTMLSILVHNICPPISGVSIVGLVSLSTTPCSGI